MESLGLIYGKYNSERFYLPKNRFRKTNKNAKDNPFKDKVVAIIGKPSSITKKGALNILEIKGAIISNGIDRSVDIVVRFQSPSNKQLDALNRIENIHSIKVINEEEFLNLTK